MITIQFFPTPTSPTPSGIGCMDQTTAVMSCNELYLKIGLSSILSTLLTSASVDLLHTISSHARRDSIIFSTTGDTSGFSLMVSLIILSCRVWQFIYSSILISATLIFLYLSGIFFTNYCWLEDKTETNCMLTLFPVVKPESPLSASQAVNELSKWKDYNFF